MSKRKQNCNNKVVVAKKRAYKKIELTKNESKSVKKKKHMKNNGHYKMIGCGITIVQSKKSFPKKSTFQFMKIHNKIRSFEQNPKFI